jgi:hypothetical protein
MPNLQAFGFELRRSNDLKSIYEDVDRILQKNDTEFKIVPNDVKFMAVAHSLNRMMKVENHFSICAIKESAIIAQIIIPKERMQIYEPLHCMHWNEMLPEFRTKVIAMILDDFRPILEPK